MEKIKVGRLRQSGYIVNYPTDTGNFRPYVFAGSKGNRVDVKALPLEVVEYLKMNSRCFAEGELKIMEEAEKVKEIVEDLGDEEKESYENNSHTREDIEKILTSNANTMKAKLSKITSKDEKQFVINVAKEIKLDSSSKLKYLAEWFGVKVDILFDEE